MDRLRSDWTGWCAGAILAIQLCVIGASAGPIVTMALDGSQLDVARLGPLERSGSSRFTVADCDRMVVDVAASSDGVTSWIVTPGGRVVDPATVAGLGGSHARFTIDADSGVAVLPFTTPGTHDLYDAPCFGSGVYEVHYAGATLAELVALQVLLQTDSAVRVRLFATESEIVAGKDVVLSAAVFDGATAVSAAAVEVNLIGPGDARDSLELADDGATVDDRAGDGLYSGAWTTREPGEVIVTARVSGAAIGGAAFERFDSTRFEVVPASGRIARITDRSIDDDGDGLIDAIVIDVEVAAGAPGTYVASVVLETESGRRVWMGGEAVIEEPSGTVSVFFTEPHLRHLDEDGPFEIASVDLEYDDGARSVFAEARVDAGRTRRYRRADFERPGLMFTGDAVDDGLDRDGDGKFEFLRVQVPVDALEPGCHRWSLGLLAGDREIARAERAGPLDGAGRLLFLFDGGAIRVAGVDGPYQLEGLIVTGANGWVTHHWGPETAAYAADQFEAPAAPQPEVDPRSGGVCPCLYCFAPIEHLSAETLTRLGDRHDLLARTACDHDDFAAACRSVRRLGRALRRAARDAPEAERPRLQAMESCAAAIVEHDCRRKKRGKP